MSHLKCDFCCTFQEDQSDKIRMILLILANFEYLCKAYYTRVHLIASIFYQMMQYVFMK